MCFVRRSAPYLDLNPHFARRIDRSKLKKKDLQKTGGWPFYTTFHDLLKAGVVAATPLTVSRLERVADAVGFPKDQIFLDDGVSR